MRLGCFPYIQLIPNFTKMPGWHATWCHKTIHLPKGMPHSQFFTRRVFSFVHVLCISIPRKGHHIGMWSQSFLRSGDRKFNLLFCNFQVYKWQKQPNSAITSIFVNRKSYLKRVCCKKPTWTSLLTSWTPSMKIFQKVKSFPWTDQARRFSQGFFDDVVETGSVQKPRSQLETLVSTIFTVPTSWPHWRAQDCEAWCRIQAFLLAFSLSFDCKNWQLEPNFGINRNYFSFRIMEFAVWTRKWPCYAQKLDVVGLLFLPHSWYITLWICLRWQRREEHRLAFHVVTTENRSSFNFKLSIHKRLSPTKQVAWIPVSSWYFGKRKSRFPKPSVLYQLLGRAAMQAWDEKPHDQCRVTWSRHCWIGVGGVVLPTTTTMTTTMTVALLKQATRGRYRLQSRTDLFWNVWGRMCLTTGTFLGINLQFLVRAPSKGVFTPGTNYRTNSPIRLQIEPMHCCQWEYPHTIC